MITYTIRRLLYVVPIILGVSLITFSLFSLVPGNPALTHASKYASEEDIKRIEAELGLDRPLPEQYLFFLKQIVTLEFGRSWTSQEPIRRQFFEGLPKTLALATPAFIGSFALSVVLSLLIAFFHGKLIDKVMLAFCITAMSISALAFIIGGQYLLAFKWGLFPVHGFEPGLEAARYIALPVIIWIALAIGPSIRLYRTVFLEEVRRDYVRTAKAKGLGNKIILFKHVLKNAMIPIMTNEIISIPFLITGSFLLENFFGIPGVGDMLINAIASEDFPVIKAYVVMMSILYIFFNVLTDILYSLVDPRVRLS